MYRVDVYLRVLRAVMVDGMSMREAARTFGLHRDTVRKMLAYSVPPGYRRQTPPRRPKLEPYTGVIDRILEDDLRRPRKQRHTAKRIFERLGDEYGSVLYSRRIGGEALSDLQRTPSSRLWPPAPPDTSRRRLTWSNCCQPCGARFWAIFVCRLKS